MRIFIHIFARSLDVRVCIKIIVSQRKTYNRFNLWKALIVTREKKTAQLKLATDFPRKMCAQCLYAQWKPSLILRYAWIIKRNHLCFID